MVLAEHGAAVVIEEKDLTGERLCQTIEELLSDPARLTELGKKAASLADWMPMSASAGRFSSWHRSRQRPEDEKTCTLLYGLHRID